MQSQKLLLLITQKRLHKIKRVCYNQINEKGQLVVVFN